VYAKFRCAPLRINKTLGIFRELITTTRTTRVAFWDLPSDCQNSYNWHTYQKFAKKLLTDGVWMKQLPDFIEALSRTLTERCCWCCVVINRSVWCRLSAERWYVLHVLCQWRRLWVICVIIMWLFLYSCTLLIIFCLVVCNSRRKYAKKLQIWYTVGPSHPVDIIWAVMIVWRMQCSEKPILKKAYPLVFLVLFGFGLYFDFSDFFIWMSSWEGC